MATICGLLALIPFILGFQLKTRKNIILANLISRIFYILQYIFLGAYAGAAFDCIGLVSSFIAKYKEKGFVAKYTATIVILINLVIVAVGILLYDNIFSIFGLVGIILEIAALWLTKEKNIRIVSLLSAPFWLTFNIANKAYASVPGNILVMISIGIAMARLDIGKNKKAENTGGESC